MADAKMHIGLNLVFLVPGETGGMEIAARELITALVDQAPDLRLTAFVSREGAADTSAPWAAIPSVTVPVHARRRSEWVRGEQALLPRLAKRHGVDLVHSLGSTAPVWGAFRRVVSIYDLIYRVYPEAHGGLRARGVAVLVPLAARRSDRIIASSSSTRDDLIRLLGVPAGKIDVVPLGVRGPETSPAETAASIRARLGLGERPVVLTLSAKRPHKNLPRLLEALALIPVERRPVLILPGYATAWESDLRALAGTLGIVEDTRFLGWVGSGELEALYTVASGFVFPSLYEGFGLPVLEAMIRGVPVACSDRSSLPEVAGGAARLFDPMEPQAIADAVEAIVFDPAEAARLASAGRARAAACTWDVTARATAAVYRRVLSPGSARVPQA